MTNLIHFVGRNMPRILVGLIIILSINAGINVIKGATDLSAAQSARSAQIEAILK